MLIRRAKLTDLDFIQAELQKFSDFYASKYSLFGKSSAYRIEKISDLINNHLFFVAELNYEPVGFICGTLYGHFFNPEIKTLTELWWWVKDEYRNTRAGAMLLNTFIRYGEENCQWIFMTLEHGSPVKPDSLLKRGFKLKENNYLLEI